MRARAPKSSTLLALGAALLLAGCERPPVETAQQGYRGTGMVELSNPRLVEASAQLHAVPEPLPPAEPGGPTAGETYQNVQVLGDLSVGEFTRLMVAMTNWVSPQQGCAYCHAGADFASDSPYPKVVARRMLEMTRHINSDWKAHVADTGVTCYTCHRGQPVPAAIWFKDDSAERNIGSVGWRNHQNIAAPSVGYSSLPYDPFSPFLSGNSQIRVVGKTPLPPPTGQSIKQTEWTYGLMIHMSDSLGVNCTFCHNSRSFISWDQSSPKRTAAWQGIGLVRELNQSYLEPLRGTYPAERLGALGDAPKANCNTCHRGVSKPLYGASMLQAHPELAPAGGTAAPSPGSSAAAPASAVLGSVLFNVGKSEISAQSMKAVGEAIARLHNESAMKVALSGFADRSGNPERNLELAKNRAFAVRDALLAGGIAQDRIQLRKPEFVIAGANADARRVDILPAE